MLISLLNFIELLKQFRFDVKLFVLFVCIFFCTADWNKVHLVTSKPCAFTKNVKLSFIMWAVETKQIQLGAEEGGVQYNSVGYV